MPVVGKVNMSTLVEPSLMNLSNEEKFKLINEAISLLDTDIDQISTGKGDKDLPVQLKSPIEELTVVKKIQESVHGIIDLSESISNANKVFSSHFSTWCSDNPGNVAPVAQPLENLNSQTNSTIKLEEEAPTPESPTHSSAKPEESNDQQDSESVKETAVPVRKSGRPRKSAIKASSAAAAKEPSVAAPKSSSAASSTQSAGAAGHPKRRGRPPKKKPMGRPRKRPPSPQSGRESSAAKRPPGRPRKQPVSATSDAGSTGEADSLSEESSGRRNSSKNDKGNQSDGEGDEDDDIPIVEMVEARGKARGKRATGAKDVKSDDPEPASARANTPAKRTSARTSKLEKGDVSATPRSTRSTVKRKPSPQLRERSKRTRAKS